MTDASRSKTAGGARSYATDYDALPYLSLPIAYTQPTRLAALAALHGANNLPDPQRARVLELGCASGGNLIPLAARWPHAQFLGLDLSAQQISDGARRIRLFQLNNVRLEQADVSDADFPRQTFDYIVCHGLLSWVSRDVQVKILKLIGQALSEEGVAAVSYNVLPGWRLRSPVRELLRYHAGIEGSAQERVARARAALRDASAGAGPGLYGDMLRAEQKLLEKIPASYILGEFLAEENNALQFSEFSALAAAHGLQFMCEADLDFSAHGNLNQDGQRRIAGLAREDRSRAAQELDFASGRPFRRTLLRRAGHSIAPPTSARLRGLHVAANLTRGPDVSGADTTYIDGRGRRLTPPTPAVAAALQRLAEAYPATLPVDALLSEAGASAPPVAHTLLKLATSGRALLSAHPIAVGRESDPHPTVWTHARAEAALGLPGLTNLHHVTVAVSPLQAEIAALADGTRDRADLARRIAGDAGKDEADRLVAEALQHFAKSAALTP